MVAALVQMKMSALDTRPATKHLAYVLFDCPALFQLTFQWLQQDLVQLLIKQAALD